MVKRIIMNKRNGAHRNIKAVYMGVILLGLFFPGILTAQQITRQNDNKELYHEHFRPQYHFSPPQHWTNDPNGLVYYAGEYHLFYQYYPGGMVWGPMHWGHAVSTDLVHWKNLPIALYPDSLGYIFSGSAVVDENNTTGFQQGKEKTIVAIFTYHNPKTEVQSQGIAYSTDKGRTWTKYADNPVLPNPGLKDFRDPKVRWYTPSRKWIMTVACGDHVQFYSSPDLKNWSELSEFGKGLGAHSGVWECPDLFPLPVKGTGKEKWVLMVNVSGGAPAGGSGTQYFLGSFNSKEFIPDDTVTRWVDYGADDYAGVTWSNTGNRTIFLGWMNNWQYANKVPTSPWRGAMTLPRELSLEKTNGEFKLIAEPVAEMDRLCHEIYSVKNKPVNGDGFVKSFPGSVLSSAEIDVTVQLNKARGFSLFLQNKEGEHVDIGYDKAGRQLFLDRISAGKDDFSQVFAKRHIIPLTSDLPSVHLRVFYDRSSVEVFINGGEWVFTDQLFPSGWYDRIRIMPARGEVKVNGLKVYAIRSVWK